MLPLRSQRFGVDCKLHPYTQCQLNISIRVQDLVVGLRIPPDLATLLRCGRNGRGEGGENCWLIHMFRYVNVPFDGNLPAVDRSVILKICSPPVVMSSFTSRVP